MRVSVLTPTVTGRERLLERARWSVLAQTVSDVVEIQHVIVDGNGYSPAEAFQRALDLADGDWVIPLSDDDWLAPHTIQTMAGHVTDSVDWVSAETLIVRSDGRSEIVGEKPDPTVIATYGFRIGGAHMWRKEVTDRIGGFDPQYLNAADYDLYWRMAEQIPPDRIVYHPEPLYFYTDHPGTDGNTNANLITNQCAAIRKAHLGAKA